MARSSKTRDIGWSDRWQLLFGVAVIAVGVVIGIRLLVGPIEVVATTAGHATTAEGKQAAKAALADDAVMANAVISTEQQSAVIVVRQADGTLRLTPPSGVCINAGTVTYEKSNFAFVVPPEQRFCGRQVRVTVLDPQTRQPLSVRDGPLTMAVAVSQ